jgi:microcystin-dependent protein
MSASGFQRVQNPRKFKMQYGQPWNDVPEDTLVHNWSFNMVNTKDLYLESCRIHLGTNAGNRPIIDQAPNSIAIGCYSGEVQQGVCGQCPTGSELCDTSSSIAIGRESGRFFQTPSSIAVGFRAGELNQGTGVNGSSCTGSAVAIGPYAGQSNQKNLAVAIGQYAGNDSQGPNTVAVGQYAGQSNQGSHSIAIGFSAGQLDQHQNSLAICSNAGRISQTDRCIAIGVNSGRLYQGSSYDENTGSNGNSISIGSYSGEVSQSFSSIAIGNLAGNTSQNPFSISIGTQAGQDSQQSDSIAVGNKAGQYSQFYGSVAIGYESGQANQQQYSVAIGYQAGYTGQGTTFEPVGGHSVAIGRQAGYSNQGDFTIAIGAYAGVNTQADNSIILNASETTFDATGSGLYVRPIRQMDTNSEYYTMHYHEGRGEVIYGLGNAALPGMIQLFAGSTAPNGYLFCDGSSYNVVDYPNLFAIIGYTYGGAAGTFNVPNLQGRVPVGLSSSVPTGYANALGQVGGEPTHQLTINEMPSHNHSYFNQPNTHEVAVSLTTTGTADNVDVNQTTGNTGGNLPHNNLQPYIVLNYIISY